MNQPREIELKLDCSALDLSALAHHPLLQAPDGAQRLLETTYYDTRKRALREAGLSLRLRREGERVVQTLKAASVSVGLFDRPEWEWDVAGPEVDRAVLRGTPAADLLPEGGDALDALFRTVVQRTERAVRYGDSQIVATLDAGRIETDGSDATLGEIELELTSGSASDLFGLAHALGASVPLRLGALSKGERGEALLAGTLRRPRKAEPLAFAPGTTAGEAFVRIAHACLRQFCINEAVFLHARDPEALHQMRVALRRLRSALSLFAPVLDGAPETAADVDALRTRLKAAIEPFGTARNLDVFLDETLPAALARRPDEPGLDIK